MTTVIRDMCFNNQHQRRQGVFCLDLALGQSREYFACPFLSGRDVHQIGVSLKQHFVHLCNIDLELLLPGFMLGLLIEQKLDC